VVFLGTKTQKKIRNAAPLINASSKFPVSSMLGRIARAERQFSALLLALSIGIPRYSSQEMRRMVAISCNHQLCSSRDKKRSRPRFLGLPGGQQLTPVDALPYIGHECRQWEKFELCRR
jgi:hypothetical protein